MGNRCLYFLNCYFLFFKDHILWNLHLVDYFNQFFLSQIFWILRFNVDYFIVVNVFRDILNVVNWLAWYLHVYCLFSNDLLFHNFLNNLWYLNYPLDNSWNDHYFFYKFDDLNYSWNLHQLFNIFLNNVRNTFNSLYLLINDDWFFYF